MIVKLLKDIYRYFYPLSPLEMYKRMGVKIGVNCKIQFDVVIDHSHYWHIEIGDNVTIAPRVHILAHDTSTYGITGYTKIGKVKIGNDVFIGAGSIILPGVTIGDNSIIGAGSVVKRNVESGMVVAGNPCKVVCSTENYRIKIESQMADLPIFGEEYTLRKGVSKELKDKMNQQINTFAFIK